MSECKLLVQDSAACKEILKYIDSNIRDINKLGMIISCEKINREDVDNELIESLRRNGITRLPVIIGPDGQRVVGGQKIKNLFNENLTQLKMPRTQPARIEMGSNPDLNDFYMREMFSGMDKNGAPVPRVDKDEADDEGASANLERRMAEYRMKGVPKHRQEEERDIAEPMDRSGRRNRREEYDDPHDREDNVADPEPPPRRGGGGGRQQPITSGMGGDEMDQRMLDAWMDNNG